MQRRRSFDGCGAILGALSCLAACTSNQGADIGSTRDRSPASEMADGGGSRSASDASAPSAEAGAGSTLPAKMYVDADGDGFGEQGSGAPLGAPLGDTLPAGFSLVEGDCDDADPTVHSEAHEECDGQDDDCDGQVDDGVINCSDGAVTPMIVAGDLFTCVLDRAGTIHCWGFQFTSCAEFNGLADCEMLEVPTGQFVEISAGGIYPNLCGLRPWGELVCVGDVAPSAEFTAGSYHHVSVGYTRVCALQPDRKAACWVGNAAPPDEEFVELATGQRHACARRADDTVACWGDGTTEATASECSSSGRCGQSLPPAGEFVQLNAGWTNTCGLRRDGSITCWGSDTHGRSSPPEGPFERLARKHGYANCAIREGGSLACWGSPFRDVEIEGTFKDVAVGSQHACALTMNDEIMCWGNLLGTCADCTAHVPPEGLEL